MRVARHLHLMGATGAIRTTSFHGREHLVVPVVALVEGVIFPVNAETPELVLASEFSTAPQGWNGRPVVAGHPVANGTQVSANSPTVLEERSFGTIFNTRIDGKRLLMEAWLDPEKAKKVGRDAERVIERALAGEPVEVSVGVFVLAENKSGSYGEKSYKAVWHEITPDHLAMLPEGVLGACSNTMGCGVRAAQVHYLEGDALEVRDAAGGRDKPSLDPPFNYNSSGPRKRRNMEQRTLAERLFALLPTFKTADANPVEVVKAIEQEVAAEAQLEDLAGKRHSSSDEELIQAMHDKSVDLGAYCAKEPAFADRFVKTMQAADGFRTALATLDPKVLEGAPDPDKEEHPFTYCKEHIIPAIVAKGQAVDDPEAFCGWWKSEHKNASARAATLKAAEGNCSCGGHRTAEGDQDMDKKARVKALIDNPASLFTAEDAAMLEALPDARLTAMETKLAADAEIKAAADKASADLKTAADKAADEAAKLAAAAAKPKTAEEWLADAPEPIRRMVTRAAAQEAAQKTELVTALKAAQSEYSEDELNGMSLEQLQRFGRVAKLAQPAPVDFGGRAPRVAEDAAAIPPPPDMNALVRAAQKKGELIN